MIRFTELKIPVQLVTSDLKELELIVKLLKDKYNVIASDIQDLKIFKKAVDARKKEQVYYVYSIDLVVIDEQKLLNRNYPNCSVAVNVDFEPVITGEKELNHRPVVIGFGPSGIFASLLLARLGYKPIVLERGVDVDTRTKHVDEFWQTGHYSEASTILFGEGGAGTFSEGKLATLINDFRCKYVLETLVNHGAQKDIIYLNKPHVGTDVLKGVIKNIRAEIISLGGEIRFNSKVTDFVIKNQKLEAVIVNETIKIDTDICLMGIGHSARETFEKLHDSGFEIRQKAFSIGLRVEHPQSLINQSQYKGFAKYLKPAEYKLSYQSKTGRGAYSFCMCPGGYVMCATSEAFGVVTNGMSESKRDGVNANAALLVNVMPEDFGSDHPLAGMYFQRRIEQKAYEAAGKNYNAPLQLMGDFLRDEISTKIGSVTPTYLPGYTFVKLSNILPDFVNNTLKEAIHEFDRRIRGFSMNDAILTGVETRSSSPIRIMRDDSGESNIKGLYPMGEGAGYAGGIMSSAVDGLKQVERIISVYKV